MRQARCVPSRDKATLRRQLQAERQALFDRQRARGATAGGAAGLAGWARRETAIGAYWPIKGEFDRAAGAVPLERGRPAAPHRPAGDRPARPSSCASTSGIPAARWKTTPSASRSRRTPTRSSRSCCSCRASASARSGLRLGYGGGFYDRTLAALPPRPVTVGVGYAHGFVPWLQAEPHDVPLDAMLTEEGVVWQRGVG